MGEDHEALCYGLFLLLCIKVSVDDLQEAAVAILKAMELRKKYMKASRQENGRIANRYLAIARHGSRDQLQPRLEKKYYTAHSPVRGRLLV